jgi:hypothetical protein
VLQIRQQELIHSRTDERLLENHISQGRGISWKSNRGGKSLFYVDAELVLGPALLPCLHEYLGNRLLTILHVHFGWFRKRACLKIELKLKIVEMKLRGRREALAEEVRRFAGLRLGICFDSTSLIFNQSTLKL